MHDANKAELNWIVYLRQLDQFNPKLYQSEIWRYSENAFSFLNFHVELYCLKSSFDYNLYGKDLKNTVYTQKHAKFDHKHA